MRSAPIWLDARRRRGRRGKNIAARRWHVEWPTVIVAIAIHGGWLALTWWHAALPLPLIVAAGAALIAWHGSLQHETIHGHPTGLGWLDAAIGAVPLSLYLPYVLYRRSHIAHHRSAAITHPDHDPESRYVAGGGRWWQHALARAQRTLILRLLVGPAVAIVSLAGEEAVRLGRDPRGVARDWLPHLAAVALIVAWLEWTGFGIGRYALLVVYPGLSLTLLRSFAEHRADLPQANRAATVERGGLLGLLYLNNHLHAAHHERPDLAWYRLPGYQRRHRRRLTGPALSYRSYGEILRRFAFRPHDAIVHPQETAA